MKSAFIQLLIGMLFISACDMTPVGKEEKKMPEAQDSVKTVVHEAEKPDKKIIIEIEKALLYNEHTLDDEYPYKDTTRRFQWEKIRSYLKIVDSVQQTPSLWGVLQNHRNKNGEAPLVKTYRRNEYKNVIDTFGIERYQSVPLYGLNGSDAPERYALDGTLIKILQQDSASYTIQTIYFEGEWNVPKKYVKNIGDTIVFTKVVAVDRTNQNITTLEKSESKWLVRSMNPATTGLHHPPLMKPTPLGIFVIQEKKEKMIFLVDGTDKKGGFAPYANRFSSGGYVHGVPVNLPRTAMIEYSPTLGTTPRSHMCVRNATSHSKFIFDWAPVDESLVVVFD